MAEEGAQELCLNEPFLEGHQETDQNVEENEQKNNEWFEEMIESGLKWSIQVNRVLSRVTSKFQDVSLLDTNSFGKILVIDGKLQSAEKDEYVYHECLVHPALLFHDNPRTVFIMGGGEGSTAREVLKHKSIEKVVMCDIDEEVVNFCRTHLTENQETFRNEKLQLVINDARDVLEKSEEKFDVIVGDLADPLEGGPCNMLYTKSFYQKILKPKLNHNGIFVTQAGPAGVLTHKEVFTSIYNTLKCCFRYVCPLNAHVPSYADTVAWVVASDHQADLMLNFDPSKADLLNKRIKERIEGELRYLNGATIMASAIFDKIVHSAMVNETHVYTEEDARFLFGHGLGTA